MLRYINTDIVFQEFPDEVTLAINISGCPCRCPAAIVSFCGQIGEMNWRLKHCLHWFMVRRRLLLVWVLWVAMVSQRLLTCLRNMSKRVTTDWRLVGILGAQQSLRSSINSISTISKWDPTSAILMDSIPHAPINECTAAAQMETLRISLPAFGNISQAITYKKSHLWLIRFNLTFLDILLKNYYLCTRLESS